MFVAGERKLAREKRDELTELLISSRSVTINEDIYSLKLL